MSRYINPVQQEEKGTDGLPYDGCKLYFYTVGTVVKKTIYKDSTFSTAQTNPVIADANGRFTGEIFLDGLYDVYLYDPDDVLIWGPYSIGETIEGPFQLYNSANTYNIPDIVLGSDDNYYRSLVDSNAGNDPTTSPGSWEQLQLGRVWNSTVTYSEGDTTYGSDGFLYISTINSNLANNPVSSPDQWRSAVNNCQSAIATGTVDAITATFPIQYTALNDQATVFVRAIGANTSTTPTFAPDGLTAKTIVKDGNQALVAGDIFGADHEMILKYNSTNDVWELLNPYGQQFLESVVYSTLPTGAVVQKATGVNVTYTTGSASMPFDDTIPQSSEGTQFQTFAFTPKLSDSTLIINYYGQWSNTTAETVVIAMFKDTDTSAISSTFLTIAANESKMATLGYKFAPGATTAITFKIRAGAASGVQELNGSSGARKLGGSIQSVIEVTEVRG